MARTVLPIVGAVVGAYFGQPQLGYAIGAVIGNAVDPVKVQGPRLGETGVQTSAEGSPRAIIYGTISCTGNVIVSGTLVIQEVESTEGGGKGGPVTSTERGYRTYAVRICEGPVGGILRIWEDEKLVYDIRNGSAMLEESARWIAGSTIYLGTEDQLPDPDLEAQVNSDMPAYRGTCYMVFSMRDLTDRRGSIPQYRFEVAQTVAGAEVGGLTGQEHITSFLAAGVNYQPPIFMSPRTGTGVQVGTRHVNAQFIATNTPYDLVMIDENCDVESTTTIPLNGDWHGAGVPYPNEVNIIAYGGNYALVRDTFFQASINGYNCFISVNGDYRSTLFMTGVGNGWFLGSPNLHQLVWFSPTHLYMGNVTHSSVNYNNITRWSLSSASFVYPDATSVSGICNTPGEEFWTHLGNDGKFRAINPDLELKTFSSILALESTETLPFTMAGPSFQAFAIEDDLAAFVSSVNNSAGFLEIRRTDDWSLVQTFSNAHFGTQHENLFRVIFTNTGLFVQGGDEVLRYEYTASGGVGSSVFLSEIVSDIHDRCQITTDKYDVTELTDTVSGLLLAGDYTGADAINTLRAPYFFDKYEADKSLWYPKRGANAAFVIDIDDLVEEPDVTKRGQAIEYPKKLHLQYQHANSGYAIVKATSSRSSPDARVIGESGLSVPVVLTENEAAQVAAKLHKVAWTEADGTIELAVPDSFIEFTPTDVGSVTLRGQTTRRRIVKSDYADGVIRWTLAKDRQSAYTSDVEGVPVPDPTPPPATITGSTVLAVMDISSRTDTEDDLNIYYGVTGAMPAWHGAMVQRSTDMGANYSNIISINTASIIGFINGPVADASEYYTDTTNVLTVTLYRDGQSIESITEAQFLSEGGAFALEKPDGSWEIMQYRDADLDTSGRFILSRLHRGLLNSGTSSHLEGALLVMLERPSHVSMSSSFIGVDLTHRAPSFEQSQELAVAQTETYIGRSQTEWPIAYLELSRSGSDISATWTPRHRFGTEVSPVASINFQGYRVTIDGGSNGSVTFDTTTAGFTNYDASALGVGLTVSVSSLNRITGAGPSTSDVI